MKKSTSPPPNESLPDPQPGMIAWYAIDGQLTAARVLSCEQGRLKVRGIRGDAGSVLLRRLLWMSESRVDEKAALEEHFNRVQSGASEVPLETLWHALVQEGLPKVLDATELTRKWKKEPSHADEDMVMAAVFRDRKFFRIKAFRVIPTTETKVEKVEQQRVEEESRLKRIEDSLNAMTTRLSALPGEAHHHVDDDEALARGTDALVDFVLYGNEAAQKGFALALLKRLPGPSDSTATMRAFQILVALCVFEPDENIYLRRGQVARAFPTPLLEEAARQIEIPLPTSRRADMTAMLTLAIDDERTTEIDDAFAIEDGRIYVFIADVAAFVKYGSHLAEEAAKRVTTLYLPTGKIPMLPSILSEDHASLMEGVQRPAICISAELGKEGALVGLELQEVMCRVDRHLTYQQADAILRDEALQEGVASDVASLVRKMGQCMEQQRAKRTRQGALLLQRNERSIDIDSDGRVSVTAIDANGPARRLVSELMVAVGGLVGEHCHDQEVPCIYRAQQRPAEAMNWGSEQITAPADQVDILRRLSPAKLTTRAEPHYTLAQVSYTQVTSPIRRYGDLVMHQQLKAMAKQRSPLFSVGRLNDLCRQIERRSSEMRRIEQDTNRYWIIRHVEQNRSKIFNGVVLRPIGSYWQVEISELAFQVLAVLHRPPEQGAPVQVRVREANARANRLMFKES
jgi:exoribonuclease-2